MCKTDWGRPAPCEPLSKQPEGRHSGKKASNAPKTGAQGNFAQWEDGHLAG